MRRFIPTLTFALGLLLAVGPAKATVAIYTGAEQHRAHQWTSGPGHTSNGIQSRPGKIYFLYEVETGRSVEIRLGAVKPLGYVVRAERNLAPLTTGRTDNLNLPDTWDTILIDAKREEADGSRSIMTVTWTGSRLVNPTLSEIDPATGLPRKFPRALQTRQDFIFDGTDPDGIYGASRIRKTSSVALMIGPTKASNAATETFDAALARVKNLLQAQGWAQETSLHNYTDY